MFVYVDDCFIIDHRETCASALRALKFACEALGLVLEPSKEAPPTCDILLLGA